MTRARRHLMYGWMTALATLGSVAVWHSRGKPLEQPIAFSHRVHVVQNKIDCAYCHEHFRRYAVAGTPSVELCVTCHSGLRTSNSEAKKLFTFWEKRHEIPWVRLHQLPDHVVFTHKRHVRAGIACETCHGTIGQSDSFVREVDHSMGKCVDCHEQRGASIECWTCHK
ncbi:MAG: cytochrome c3 family protein [Acidobacteria bacterium]|nr:cytochrome c3 family protein [Acidobacteriota bacterium]